MRRRHEVALDEVVRDLPEGFVALTFGDAHLVVGPTGAFALTEARGAAVGEAAQRIMAVVREIRQRLVAAMSWSPFVDPIVVTDGRIDRRHRLWGSDRRGEPLEPGTERVGVVPRRIVRSVLASGRHQLSLADVQRIYAALR